MFLRDYLQQAGAIVFLTREGDQDLADDSTKGLSRRKTQDLHRRGDLIDEKNADLILSVHLNSFPSSKYAGAQTFYYPKGHLANKRLAQIIQEQFKKELGSTREIKPIHDFYLLKISEQPGALVEVGFLSNPNESELLQKKGYQQKIAHSIYHGIMRFQQEQFGDDTSK